MKFTINLNKNEIMQYKIELKVVVLGLNLIKNGKKTNKVKNGP